MMEALFSSPLFAIALSVFAYMAGLWLNRKTHLALFNPLLVAYVIVISFLLVFSIPLEWYEKGGSFIDLFLAPATTVLALTIYRQRNIVRQHLLAVFAGTIAGSIASMGFIWVLSRILNLPEDIAFSLLPKSITTPLAIAVSNSTGGIQAVTVLAVIITGITGNILAPIVFRLFRIKDEIVQGISIGTASHAVGTSKALELGEIQGALSSVAMAISGIITVIVATVVFPA